MYQADLDWYDLYVLIVSLWLLSSSQIKVSVLQDGASETWKVVQCQLKFASYLSVSFFWYYSFSLLLFADADKIPHSYTTFSFFASYTCKQKRRCQEEMMVWIHTFLWQTKVLMAMLSGLQTVTVYLLHTSNVKKHLLWKVLV